MKRQKSDVKCNAQLSDNVYLIYYSAGKVLALLLALIERSSLCTMKQQAISRTMYIYSAFWSKSFPNGTAIVPDR